MEKRFLSIAAACSVAIASFTSDAKITHILPRPQQVEAGSGATFQLSGAINLTDPTECELLSEFLTGAGCSLQANGRPVTVNLVSAIDGAYEHQLPEYPSEAYKIEITADRINISAVSPTGVLRAAQTLIQMAEGYDDEGSSPALEAATITDWPAFKLRGFMHDVGRSFIDADEIIKQIELYSRFKVNTFHWHLTENQAWRFEVKSYPKLTQASSMTRYAGKYYTQDDCRRVMAAARKHGVTVIPEIDMPGHSEAFERAMGFEMQSTAGKEVLLKVLEEVVDVFSDAPYIHIGADEKTITDNTFLPTMTAKIHELGKKVVCWNPIRGVSITANSGFDMTQMWSSSGKVISGIPNIDCRYNYTNHFDVFADLVGIYKSSIYYAEKGTPDIAGTISCPWNDRKTPTQEDIIRQNNVYANTIASAERAWIGGGRQYIETGGTTLPNSGPEFEEFADWERRFLFHKDHSLKNEPIPYVKQTNVRWMITEPFPNGGSATATFPPETAENPGTEFEYNGKKYGASIATGAGIYLRHTWGSVVPTFYNTDYGTGHTAYAYTYIYSPEDRPAGALIEFQNYGRSENDTAPANGQWDRKGSRIWLNDVELKPMSWTNAGKTINSEVDLGNENFTAREPLQIELKSGWNKVMIKLPYIAANGVRLNKWMFTFVVTDTEGRNALDDLIYSPSKSLNAESEILSALLLEVKTWLRSEFSDNVGYYSPSAASKQLEALVAEAEEAIANPEADCEALMTEITAAFEALKSTYKEGGLNMPVADTYYYLSTPLRDNRYMTSAGAGAGVVGNASTSKASGWKFDLRQDGSYNIVNCADGSYLAPTASYNTQISTSATTPSKGWTIKAADATGYVILTCGDVQLNQTTSSLGYKVYNWGSGNETSDLGCKYVVEKAADLNGGEIKPVEIPDPELTLIDITLDGSAPYRVAPQYADPIISTPGATTVALDCTPATAPECAVYAATSSSTSENFFSLAMLDGNRVGPRYIGLSNGLEGWYTQSCSVSARHQIVLVTDSGSGYTIYLNGSLLRNIPTANLGEYGLGNFGAVDGGDALYLGGFATATNSNKYPLTGSIHSARFWTEPLTAEQVAALDYDNLIATDGITNIGNSDKAICVTAGHGFVQINGSSSVASVYSPEGRLLAKGRNYIEVPSGIAIINVDGQTYKCLVR